MALSASTSGDKAWIHIITSDNAKTLKIVSALGWGAVEKDVVRVSLENKAGAAHAMSLSLASADINIETVYGSSWDTKACALIVVPSDVERAVKVLESITV